MVNKVCKKCGVNKNLECFYLHKKMSDGRLSFCKDCVKERMRKYSKTDRAIELVKEWNKTDKGKAVISRHRIKYRKLYPQKYKAHNSTNNAIARGVIKKEPCRVCGEEKVEAHHEDYSKPFYIKWFCQKHHREYENNLSLGF